MEKTTNIGKYIALLAAFALVIGCLAMAGCADSGSAGSKGSTSNSTASSSHGTSSVGNTASSSDAGDMTVTNKAILTIKGYDPVTIDLYGEEAPLTVANFVGLAESGYYDGLALYRIQDGFVIQGGTKGDNASGSDPSLSAIEGEFSENGHENALADNFDTGVVAMARTNVPDSATSTFFITLGPASKVGPSLDGKYAAFGTIDAEGMAIIEEVVNDYKEYAGGNMGAISDSSHMPVIESIVITE